MLFVRHWSSKWSQEKCIKRADVDLDPTTQHTAKILQAAHIWVWSTLLLISAGWGNHCPKYLGFVVDKVSIYRVIRVQLTHWNFCCKTIIDYPSLRAKEDFFFIITIILTLRNLLGTQLSQKELQEKKDWGSGSACQKWHFQSYTKRQQRNSVLQHSFMGVITKDMQIM